jgi:hypothetical protein
MSGTFKSSGSIAITDVNNFISSATNNLSVKPSSSIRIGSANFGEVGQLMANLKIWNASLPNGDLVSPHRLSETYSANIPDSASTLEGKILFHALNRYTLGSSISLNSNAKLTHFIEASSDAANHWVKYTAKIYDSSNSQYGTFNSSNRPNNPFLFPDDVKNNVTSIAGALELILQRFDFSLDYRFTTDIYIWFHRAGYGFENPTYETEYLFNYNFWGVVRFDPGMETRGGTGGGTGEYSVYAKDGFDWLMRIRDLNNDVGGLRISVVGIQIGSGEDVNWKNSNVTYDSYGPVFVHSQIKSNKTLIPSFAPISDSSSHLILSQYQETDPDFIPDGYNKVLVQEGLVKLNNLQYSTTLGDGTDIYSQSLDIAFDTNSLNLANYSFMIDGISPLGIQRNSSSSYSIVNAVDSTAETTFSNKNDAIAYWEDWVYNKRYHNGKNIFQNGSFYSIFNDEWRQIFTMLPQNSAGEDMYESEVCYYGLLLPYIDAGYSSSNPYPHNNKRLPSSTSGGLKFHPVYYNMIPKSAKIEIEKSLRFLEKTISNNLDIEVYIMERNAEEFGSSVLASAGPFDWDVGQMNGYTRVNSIIVFYDPIDFLDDQAYSRDELGRTSIFNIFLHEMMHGLGVGYWEGNIGNPNFLTTNSFGTQYTGTYAIQKYQAAIAAKGLNNTNSYYYSYVPIDGGSNGHIAEFSKTDGSKIQPAFYNELMTPFYNGYDDALRGANPISEITLGFLQDLGYTVDYSKADSSSYLRYNLNDIPAETSSAYDRLSNPKLRVCSCGMHH